MSTENGTSPNAATEDVVGRASIAQLPDESLDRSERIIAVSRVMLSISALVIVVLNPREPMLSISALYVVLGSYIAYSSLLLWLFTYRGLLSRQTSKPILAADIAWSTLIVALGEGGVSPFFLFYFFAVCSAAVGWGLNTTLRVAGSSAVLYVVSVLLVRRFAMGPEFNLHTAHFLRPVYLVLLGYLVGLIGEYELSAKRRLIELVSMQREAGSRRPTVYTLARLFRRILAFFEADYALLQLRPTDAPPLEWEGTTRRSGETIRLAAVEPGSWTTESAGDLSYRVSHTFGNWGRTVEAFAESTVRSTVLSEGEEPGFLARSRVRSLISIPVSSQQGVRGRLMLGRSSANFSREDVTFCRTLAAQAGVVLDNVILQQKAEALAVAEERARIARDIHDGFVQSLASIDVGIEVVRQIGKKKPDALSGELEDLQRTVKHGYRQARGYMDQLRDRSVRSLDINEAARRLVSETRQRSEIDIELRANAVGFPAEDGVGFDAVQIVREGLTNIARHADADSAFVSIDHNDDAISIVIRDNGRGFPNAPEGEAGTWADIPLSAAPWSIRERVEARTGSFRLRSRSGAGSELSVTLPIAA